MPEPVRGAGPDRAAPGGLRMLRSRVEVDADPSHLPERESQVIASARSESPALRRYRSRLTELWEVEIKLDEKLDRTPTWSDRWWHLLGQLDIVRKQRIKLGGIPSIQENPFATERGHA